MTRAITLSLALAAIVAAPAGAQSGGGQAPAPNGQPAPPPAPAPKLEVQPPTRGALIREGQDGRYLLGGRWYFRLDDALVGDSQRFFAQRSLEGWSAIRVPHVWNGPDLTQNRSSVGWYRREFRLPSTPRGRYTWKARFESANFRSVVFLNGRRIGGGTSGFFPFEAELKGLRRGRNTLVVKVSSLRSSSDLTHWRPASFNGYGTGGWYNFGGLQREVYLRRVRGVDVENVQVLPRLRSLRGPARVGVRMRVRNFSGRDRDVGLSLTVRGPGFSTRVTPRMEGVAGRGGGRDLNASFQIPRPRLWQPGRPALYSLAVSAGVDGQRLSTYRTAFGVKKLARGRNGALLLNGRKLNLRGASIHEDEPGIGSALGPRQRAATLRRLRDLGATVTRAHYPLHPALMESLDRAGILFWSQAPVYQLSNAFLSRAHIRAAAIEANRRTIFNNVNHASIFTWSIANELAEDEDERGVIGPGTAAFIRDARRAVRQLDDTRLIGIDRHSRIGETIFNSELAALDVLGVNEYFGWYRTVAKDLNRPPSTTEELAGVSRPGARGLPAHTARGHGVRRRGQPPGPGHAKGHLRVPDRLDAQAPGHPRLEALRERLDRLGAQGLPRAPRVGRRGSRRVRHAALAQQEPDRGERRRQAGVSDRAPDVPPHAAAAMKLAPLALAAALALGGCGISSGGDEESADPNDKRAVTLECLTEEQGVKARLAGRNAIQVGDSEKGPRILFFLTGGQAEAEQFAGDREGSEQIGNALLFVRDGSEQLLEDVEYCLDNL